VSSLLVLIPVALGLLGVAIWAFVWAVDHEQFEDLENEGARILLEEDPSADLRPSDDGSQDGAEDRRIARGEAGARTAARDEEAPS